MIRDIRVLLTRCDAALNPNLALDEEPIDAAPTYEEPIDAAPIHDEPIGAASVHEDDAASADEISQPAKKRKKNAPLQYEGYTYHHNKTTKDGKTIYLDCAEWVISIYKKKHINWNDLS